MCESSIGTDKGTDLLIASERQAVCIEATYVGVSYTSNPDFIDEELLSAPLCLLVV